LVTALAWFLTQTGLSSPDEALTTWRDHLDKLAADVANRCDVTHSHDQMKAEQDVWVFGGKKWEERQRISSARRSGKVVRKWCAAGMKKPRPTL
jgi:hypothetical protein